MLSELRIEREQKFADRIRFILLIDEGKDFREIAHFLFLDEKTIYNWKKRYEEGGVEKLVNDHYIGRVSRLNQEQIEILQGDLESKIFPKTDSVIAHIEGLFGLSYPVGGMTMPSSPNRFFIQETKGPPRKRRS